MINAISFLMESLLTSLLLSINHNFICRHLSIRSSGAIPSPKVPLFYESVGSIIEISKNILCMFRIYKISISIIVKNVMKFIVSLKSKIIDPNNRDTTTFIIFFFPIQINLINCD